MSEVTVLTASLPERAGMLAEAIGSVAAQSHPVAAHLIGVDVRREGAPVILTRLAAVAATEWLMVLDDDDLLDPHHVKTLLGHVEHADVVFSYCRAEGHDFDWYNHPFDPQRLEDRSCVSHTALFRRVLASGWDPGDDYDWRFWQRLARSGARFVAIPEVTWTYRGGHPQQSKGTL
jgi:hypothetical protein